MRFRFNEKKATQAAAHLVKRAGGKFNYTHLLKLLFLADREMLKEKGIPITGARMTAMYHGPLLSEPYNLIKGDALSFTWTDHLVKDGYDVRLIADIDTDELTPREEAKLDAIYDTYGHWDLFEKLIPWLHENIGEWQDPGKTSKPIEYEASLRAQEVPDDTIARMESRAEMLWRVSSR